MGSCCNNFYPFDYIIKIQKLDNLCNSYMSAWQCQIYSYCGNQGFESLKSINKIKKLFLNVLF